jgi:hypothetical protein
MSQSYVDKLNAIKLEMNPNETYCATDKCNPLTARLIILFNETICPFIKDEFIKNQNPRQQAQAQDQDLELKKTQQTSSSEAIDEEDVGVKNISAKSPLPYNGDEDPSPPYNDGNDELETQRQKDFEVTNPAPDQEQKNVELALVFYWFCCVIFSDNLQYYNSNELKWLKEKIKTIEKLTQDNSTSKQIIVQLLESVNAGNINNNLNSAFSTINPPIQITNVALNTDLNLFLLFLEFAAIVKNYYVAYYNKYLAEFVTSKSINITECVPIKIRIYLYPRPVDTDTLKKIREVIKSKGIDELIIDEPRTRIEKIKIDRKIYGTYRFLNNNVGHPGFHSWDEIFRNSHLFINEDILKNIDNEAQRIIPQIYCNTSDTQSSQGSATTKSDAAELTKSSQGSMPTKSDARARAQSSLVSATTVAAPPMRAQPLQNIEATNAASTTKWNPLTHESDTSNSWRKPQPQSVSVHTESVASVGLSPNSYAVSSNNASSSNENKPTKLNNPMSSRGKSGKSRWGGTKTPPNHVSEHNNALPSKNITYPKKKKMHNKSYRKRRAN